MSWRFVALLAVVLAGCADTGNFDRDKPVKLTGLVEPTAARTKPVSPMSSMARAEAPKTETSENGAPLMQCVSEACKTQCSSGPDNGSRPKWCMYFKKPDDKLASEQGKGAE